MAESRKKSLAPDVSEAEEPEADTAYKQTTRPFNPADADGRVCEIRHNFVFN